MSQPQSWCIDTVTRLGKSLRIRSSGAPTAGHQGPARGARTFSQPGPWRPAVVAHLAQTLGCTFRHCGLQASQFKCSFRQPLVQYRSWCRPFVALSKVVAMPTTRPVTNAALTSFGVRESRRLFAPSPNTARTCRWPFTSHHTQARAPGLCGCVSRHRSARLSVTR
jgi:hypothetical protein